MSARAILRKNKIDMMDEATANVDNETDRLIQETGKSKFEGCTLLIIAHRLRTVINSDRFWLLTKEMQEFGSPLELLIMKACYFETFLHNAGVSN